MKDKIQTFLTPELLQSYLKDIKQMETLATAINSKGIKVGENGTIDIIMTPNQLSELISAKRQIFQMKREAVEFQKDIENEDSDLPDSSELYKVER